MTPFAREIAGDLLKPVAKRNAADHVGMTRLMAGAHFFELTAVFPMLRDVSEKFEDDFAEPGHLAFLPAPKTWLEWSQPARRDGRIVGSVSVGILLVEQPDLCRASVYMARKYSAVRAPYEADKLAELGLATNGTPSPERLTITCSHDGNDRRAFMHDVIYAALTIINSPKVINRRQHQPDRGFERALNAHRGLTGSFPLHAWTEILLSVNTHDAAGSAPASAHLTGARALHFCRSFVRVRLGQIEIVRSHWRGDASIGIKRSRYTVGARP